MVDDQDRCEWVNVSSGTGSTGQSWTKGHKMVVLVAVAVAAAVALLTLTVAVAAAVSSSNELTVWCFVGSAEAVPTQTTRSSWPVTIRLIWMLHLVALRFCSHYVKSTASHQ